MQTHWPIYQMIEQEIDKLCEKPFNELLFEKHARINFATYILPKIQKLELWWISVEERLPEFWEDVLVYDNGFHYEAYRTRKNSLWNWNWLILNTFHAEEAIAYNVTHWMPLPLPPKE